MKESKTGIMSGRAEIVCERESEHYHLFTKSVLKMMT